MPAFADSSRTHPVTKHELIRRLAEFSTRPVSEMAELVKLANPAQLAKLAASQSMSSAPAFDPRPTRRSKASGGDLFVWFEDTSARWRDGKRGIAGMPESLLPAMRCIKVHDRRYAQGHLHLLCAVRLVCSERLGEAIAAISSSALGIGTVAWIGTGEHYAAAWREMFDSGNGRAPNPDPAGD
jgi:hypothetical protein